MITKREAALELSKRREARKSLLAYINYTNPSYQNSLFSKTVCDELDRFIERVLAGKRPIIVFQSPPQHGKSEIVSRKLPAYIMGKYPNLRLCGAAYSDELAGTFARDVRRNLDDTSQNILFPVYKKKHKYDVNRISEFTSPGGRGAYVAVGIGAGLTGRPVDIGIIDDPIKNEEEALSEKTKKGHWNWYQTVFSTRFSEKSGQIIMATSWAEDDLPARICRKFAGDPRLTVLRFPAINFPGEVGYNPALPEGALIPEFKSLAFLQEMKSLMSEYWWSALYQQSAKALGGNVFKDKHVQYYLPKDLPERFDKVIASWDCTFKDTDGTDYVVGQVWGKKGANSYLLDQVRDRMSFTRTVKEVIALKEKWPQIREILIEDKANGPAVIDTIKQEVSGVIAIEPDGSKLARAHAVTSWWEANNILLPSAEIAPWVKDYIAELTAFPAAANDDQVDSTSQALRRLYPLFNRMKIAQAAINKAMGIRN